ncbi:MAG TPA: hypothetical protein PK358_04820 [Spirochaetota bacterium]|nr:hypothetical protein [Spirochaetota bacterium]HPJ34135.1 hypothetical protein [Spirochaetota bacterium]
MKKLIITSLSVFLLILLPAAGIILSGGDIIRYTGFPPAAGYVEHPPFSWAVFIILAGFIFFVLLHPVIHIIRSGSAVKPVGSYPFPWWGYAGVCTGLLSWIVAWTRLPLLHELQRWTFLPLWLSYIIIVNALCVRRTGSSLLTGRRGYYLALFPLSALFWWVFEYLNRFTANWYYTGTGSLAPMRYFLEATLAFSTVLPAVMATAELVKSYPRLYSGSGSYIRLRPRNVRATAFITIIISGISLFFTGIYPEWLFPLLWVSPAVLLISMQVLAGDDSVADGIGSGDWRAVAVYSLAALICGFFWEMWNIESMARWRYSIPFVHGFKLFEMPLLGYAGYLPFGIECAVVAGIISGRGEEPWRTGYLPSCNR